MKTRAGGRLNAFQPPVRRLRFWLFLVGLWSVPVAIGSIVIYIRALEGGEHADWTSALTATMPYWYLWALLTPLVLWLVRRFPVEGARRWKNLAVHAGLAVIIGAIHGGLTVFTRQQLVEPSEGYALLASLETFASAYSPFEYLIYWAILGAGYLVDYHDRYRSSAVRAAQLEAQLAQAHLQALRVQLQPHFLFNTLHSISSLMDEDLETARRMLVRLGDLLRLTLETQGIHEVTLQQELECMETYLDIERVRFPEQLTIEMLVAPDTLDALVPNLILQPLVENAVRYGIAPKQNGGRITITATREDDFIRLQVLDDGAGMRAGGAVNRSGGGSGVGLANVRGRLAELYGRAQKFRVFEPNGGGFGVELTFPFRLTTQARSAR